MSFTNISAWDDPVVIGRRILHRSSNSCMQKQKVHQQTKLASSLHVPLIYENLVGLSSTTNPKPKG